MIFVGMLAKKIYLLYAVDVVMELSIRKPQYRLCFPAFFWFMLV